MKKNILIAAFILVGKISVGQFLDSVYYFTPSIVPGVSSLRMTDSPFIRTMHWEINTDSSDIKILRVAIFHNHSLVQDGRYKLSKIDTAYKMVMHRDGGPFEKRPSKVNLTYVRDGYWRFYKNGSRKSVYYFEGKPLKEKM